MHICTWISENISKKQAAKLRINTNIYKDYVEGRRLPTIGHLEKMIDLLCSLDDQKEGMKEEVIDIMLNSWYLYAPSTKDDDFHPSFDESLKDWKGIDLIVPIKAVATPRPRVSTAGSFARAYYPKKYTNYETKLISLLKETKDNLEGAEDLKSLLPLSFPIEVDIVVHTRSKYHPIGRSHSKPDVDNLAKGILDCLTKSGWLEDDRFVCSLHIKKVWSFWDHIEISID